MWLIRGSSCFMTLEQQKPSQIPVLHFNDFNIKYPFRGVTLGLFCEVRVHQWYNLWIEALASLQHSIINHWLINVFIHRPAAAQKLVQEGITSIEGEYSLLIFYNYTARPECTSVSICKSYNSLLLNIEIVVFLFGNCVV